MRRAMLPGSLLSDLVKRLFILLSAILLCAGVVGRVTSATIVDGPSIDEEGNNDRLDLGNITEHKEAHPVNCSQEWTSCYMPHVVTVALVVLLVVVVIAFMLRDFLGCAPPNDNDGSKARLVGEDASDTDDDEVDIYQVCVAGDEHEGVKEMP